MVEKVLSEVLEGPFFQYVYNLLKANVLRDRRIMSLVLLQEGHGKSETIGQVSNKLQMILREKDVLFDTGNAGEIGILLPHSATDEATGFLRRLQGSCEGFTSDSTEVSFKAAIIEVYHPDLTADHALAVCRSAMSDVSDVGGLQIIRADAGLGQPVVSVKVSILDGDRLFREFLRTAVERIDMPGIGLTVRDFEDGLLLLSDSDWTGSWHPHLVVMSDVLPKKNGLDVLQELRQMPNEDKFTILMMTRRNSEEEMIYAYESGTDGYLVKPFNLRLFEAQVRRMLAGLWS